MSQPFKHSADSLLSFFSQPGRGFYVPYYQRNYSWDEDNASKLISDIIGGVKRALNKPNNSIFLGTVILHDENNVEVGVHTDTPNLLTKVSNVVDGQQRISSLGMLACTLSYIIQDTVQELNQYISSASEIATLVQELQNQKLDLFDFFCVEIKKGGAQPNLKPLIIRAGDVTSNPVSDQWTLAGSGNHFYRSNTASFFSEFISGNPFLSINKDSRVECVVNTYIDQIKNELGSVDSVFARSLLSANSTQGGSLNNFMDYPPNLSNINNLPNNEQKVFYSGMMLLAICHFLKSACHFVVIECQDEGIAFDMFQSLNATGTPLTAFEVFRPVIVKKYGTGYASTIKDEVDRIESVFEKESTASGKEELTDKVIASAALAYDGSIISNRFSEERDWLIDTFQPLSGQNAKDFVCCIASQAEYRDNIIRPRKSPKNSQNIKLVNHLLSLGLNPQQADMSAFCIFYLRDAGHKFAHSVISVFYAKLLSSQGNTTKVASAANEFLSICKATAAFFTLWIMLSPQGKPVL